jgi:hypothetical protein
MPSSSRSRAATRRTPRPAPRTAPADAGSGTRPLEVVLAVVFGVLVAAEYAYLAWLLWTPEVGWDWFMLVPLLLAVLALVAAAGVFTGRRGSRLLLVVAAALLLVILVVLAGLFAVLGGGAALWSAVGLLVGPVGCLVLALRRPVRDWTRPAGAGRPAGGRRTGGSAR